MEIILIFTFFVAKILRYMKIDFQKLKQTSVILGW